MHNDTDFWNMIIAITGVFSFIAGIATTILCLYIKNQIQSMKSEIFDVAFDKFLTKEIGDTRFNGLNRRIELLEGKANAPIHP